MMLMKHHYLKLRFNEVFWMNRASLMSSSRSVGNLINYLILPFFFKINCFQTGQQVLLFRQLNGFRIKTYLCGWSLSSTNKRCSLNHLPPLRVRGYLVSFSIYFPTFSICNLERDLLPHMWSLVCFISSSCRRQKGTWSSSQQLVINTVAATEGECRICW